MANKVVKKTKKKNITKGVAHIHSTNQNTIVTFADELGNVIAWSSSGAIGYKGTKKKTPYASRFRLHKQDQKPQKSMVLKA